MARKTVESGHRVVIEPAPSWLGPRTLAGTIAVCEAIKDGINRVKRADFVDNIGDVYIEHDTDHVCEHCNYPWGEESTVYNGGCCEEDEKANPERTTPSETTP